MVERMKALQRAQEIEAAIREVLLRDWDPIGIADVPEAADEYDSYIGGVHGLLASGADEQRLAAHLAAIQTEAMGLPQTPEYLLHVARQLRSINIKLRE